MRIGLEMFGTQTASRHRGIGRYCRNLAAALVQQTAGTRHTLILYAEDGLPTDLVPIASHATLHRLRPEPTLRDTIGKLTLANPDNLDILLFLNPLELTPGFDIPSRPLAGPKLAAIVYDLIPLIFQDDYLRHWPGSEYARRYLWALDRLRGYDRLLTISEATRLDTLRLLNAAPERVVTIGTAGDDRVVDFTPDRDDPADLVRVRRLGLTRPFVYSVSASDPRKNLNGLVEAFAQLPTPLRETHQLAVTATLDPSHTGLLHALVSRLGLRDDAVVLTGWTDDLTLRALYRRAEVFVFPSLYEGFGLPIVEAMGSGAAVVAGDNSSQIEAAGKAGLLVNVADSSAIALALERVLNDSDLAWSLRERGPAQARRFSWNAVAARTLEALMDREPKRSGLPRNRPLITSRLWGGPDNLLSGRRSRERPGQARPDHRPQPTSCRFATLTTSCPGYPGIVPFPEESSDSLGATGRTRPVRAEASHEDGRQWSSTTSGNKLVAVFLSSFTDPKIFLNTLDHHNRIDLFHDSDDRPVARFQFRQMGCFDRRLFNRLDRLRPYERILVPSQEAADRLIDQSPTVVGRTVVTPWP